MTPTPVVLPPTAQLPPIKNLNNVPLKLLHEAIQYLQIVYNPEIHTSRRIITTTAHHGSDPAPRTTPTGARPIHESGSANDGVVMEPLRPESELIRVDAFEHAYVVRWLTTLIAQKTTLHDDDGADKPDKDEEDHDHNDSALDLESLVQSAAALLAICAGAASAGTRTRTYVLGGGRVRVQLTDVALRNDDFESVGAQTWGSACVLAEMIAEAPARFGLRIGGDGNCNDDASSSLLYRGGEPRVGEAAAIRVLELGAGTGLVSLTIGKILEPSRGYCRERDNNSRRAEIVASDFYPPALENLRLNIQRNFPSNCNHGSDSASGGNDLSISAHLLNWEEEAATEPTRAPGAPFDVPFDEVFGADIVYELEHAAWINGCLGRFLRLTGRFHLVIPLRESFARESATVERVFPRAEDVHRVMETEPTLCITQKERITCEAWPDGKGEVEYVHYTIQWAVCEDRGIDSVHVYSEPSDI
jgi:Lysine methyltransferase